MLSQAHSACSKLYDERAKRITALKSHFPPLHFVILTALALSICVAFLLETKQDILVFLNAIQLRVLWTMLVGTFTALAIVCFDLSHPFQGSYQISNNTVQQLYSIRRTLQASITMLKSQEEKHLQRHQTEEKEEEFRQSSSMSSTKSTSSSSSLL